MAGFVMVLDTLVRRWRCQRRGLCCKGHAIQVDRVGLTRIRAALVAAGDPRADRIDLEAPPGPGGWREVPRDPDGACMFLTSDQLCSYRMAHGTETLPAVCKKYPFIQLWTPDRLRVGVSFTCPTALGLLAEQSDLEVVEDDGEPPADAVTHLAAADRPYLGLDGEELGAEAFWAEHQRLADAFDAAGGGVAERLAAVVEAAGAEAPAPFAISARAWRLGPLDGELGAQVAALDEAPPGLLRLWSQGTPHEPPRMPAFDGDEDALLRRYLAHRLLVPAFYAAHTDVAWLLAMLYTSVARYRVDRGRGATPLAALREVDMLLVHSGMPRGLFGDGRPAWRALAAIATA